MGHLITFDMGTRDLACEVVQLYCEQSEMHEPTLKIWKKNHPRRPAYIPLPSAYKYHEPEDESDAVMAIQETAHIARFLGMPEDKGNLLRFLLWIQDKLPLIVSAPLFIHKERVIGHADLTFDGVKSSIEMRL